MRSLVMAVFLFMSALSSALGEAFVCEYHLFRQSWSQLSNFRCVKTALSADPLLVWNYGIMGVLALVSGFLFWWSTADLDAREDQLNNLVEGRFQAEPVNNKGNVV